MLMHVDAWRNEIILRERMRKVLCIGKRVEVLMVIRDVMFSSQPSQCGRPCAFSSNHNT